ncbi:hypothetical protein GCM10010168_91280 [Actinoplanes ianthinogenes]|uniref:Uncharacterized protein n=1 Tax=Actinoplanes ianthinogenes TaxID=122358 RepID=A0ABN6CE30_9ACTN|nr:hypothetical protein [Actinoplanes ianthinogenes]BCJ43829.1 hypothetical protein Aiant_44860 [Actinoplanes ianthinogenes]GGR58178.1 hypothetical protein GCM10010168_91280 [Actinoplanes ianthinogenes]
MRLSELLDEVRAEAPPPRYDVDQVVAAGRRLQWRRRVAAAAAAVLTVTAVVAVPQLAGGPPPSRLTAPVAQVVPMPFTYAYDGFTAGRFRVEETHEATIDWTLNMITDVRDPDRCRMQCMLGVRATAVTDPVFQRERSRTAAEPINGRPAYWLLDREMGDLVLLWEYADDGWAFIARPNMKVEADAPMSRDEMRTVAAAFRPGSARTVPSPFRPSYLPADWRLVETRGIKGSSTAILRKVATAESMRQPTSRTISVVKPPRAADLLELVARPSGVNKTPTAEPICVKQSDGGYCRMRMPERDLDLDVRGGTALSLDELRRITLGMTVADLGKPATWTPINDAFPASAQLTVVK